MTNPLHLGTMARDGAIVLGLALLFVALMNQATAVPVPAAPPAATT